MEDKKQDGELLIRGERSRQIMEEGYTSAHDDDHYRGELEYAADCYAGAMDDKALQPNFFPFAAMHWKPKDRKTNLIRAGALYIAEMDRLTRVANAVSTAQAMKRCGDKMRACAIMIDAL